MTSLNTALRIATTSLQFNQLGISTLSHNISNTNTPGYSRQTVNAGTVSLAGFGGGVALESIQRHVDNILDRRVVSQTSESAYANAKEGQMANIDAIFGSTASANTLDKLTSNMFSQFSQLSNYPDSGAQRQNVLQTAELFGDSVRGMYNDLSDLATRIDEQISNDLTAVNTALKNIAKLNADVVRLGGGDASGANSNDIKDSRARELAVVANYFGLQVSEDNQGQMRVLTENGRKLVEATDYVHLERSPGTPYQSIGARNVLVDGSLGTNVQSINMNTISKGAIKGLMDVRDIEIVNRKAELDRLAGTVATEMNKLHSRGTGVPLQNSFTSGNAHLISTNASNLFTDLGAGIANNSFNISIVDSNGGVISSTLPAAGGGGPITFPGAGPYSLTDLATAITGNANVGGSLTVSTTADGSITIAATNTNHRVVLANGTGDPLGLLGMNNFWTGTTAADLDIVSTIQTNPGLIATARMRSDGGVSLLDNRNVVEIAKLIDTEFSFSAAGGLPARTTTLSNYGSQMMSLQAINSAAVTNQREFHETLLTDLKEQQSSVSGVNMDEELAQMLVYQSSFQASARLVGIVDELLQTLISLGNR